jgi:FixJ family two-component response regulator
VHLLREVELVMGELPVVFITGYARVDIPPSVLQRATTRLVEKPFRLDALLETLELVLHTARAPMPADIASTSSPAASR